MCLWLVNICFYIFNIFFNFIYFSLDENILKEVEGIGYKKDYLIKALKHNEVNYATASYFILENALQCFSEDN